MRAAGVTLEEPARGARPGDSDQAQPLQLPDDLQQGVQRRSPALDRQPGVRVTSCLRSSALTASDMVGVVTSNSAASAPTSRRAAGCRDSAQHGLLLQGGKPVFPGDSLGKGAHAVPEPIDCVGEPSIQVCAAAQPALLGHTGLSDRTPCYVRPDAGYGCEPAVRSTASRWARWPSRSRMVRISTGPPWAVIACGDMVENWAA